MDIDKMDLVTRLTLEKKAIYMEESIMLLK